MEPISGDIAEGDWRSLSGIYTTEEADFMAQLLGNFPVSTEFFNGSSLLGNSSSSSSSLSSTFCPSHGANEGSHYSLNFLSSSSQECFYLSDSLQILGTNNINNNNNNDIYNNHSSISMEICMGDANYNNNNASSYIFDQVDHEGLSYQENYFSDIGDKQELGIPVEASKPKKKSEIMQSAEPAAIEEKLNNPSENSKKRSRNATAMEKKKRNVKKEWLSARNSRYMQSNDAEINKLQASSSCGSEDEWNNASQDQNGGGDDSSMSSKGKSALNLSGKTRASRGSATDPQSLYARKRRERINERLRILQNLVPNGTKVDISTMLEEAVQYVKFLQLQIKLLSSDDLWMYAPIAYNGMNIGLDHLMLSTASKLS